MNSVSNKLGQKCQNNKTKQLICDVNYSGIDHKFVNSILHAKQSIGRNKDPNLDSGIFQVASSICI